MFIAIASLVFGVSICLNSNNKLYKEQQTYSNVKALDIIAANPVIINDNILQKNKFTRNDISLLQSWLVADGVYLSGEKTAQLADALKSSRDFVAVKFELNKFISDERYLLFVYAASFLLALFFARIYYRTLIMNMIVFVVLLLYLTIAARIPHRVMFPLLTYLILINTLFLLKSNLNERTKNVIFFLLLIVSGYKFYCTTKLITIHNNYHEIFLASKNEIKNHPENLFIGADGFPLQYMNAWDSPAQLNFPAHNLILTGWYACSPDYQVLLKMHHIFNLTSSLKNKNNVLFLSNSTLLLDSYIKVMKERYNIICHFEEQTDGFKVLQPKKLVIDN